MTVPEDHLIQWVIDAANSVGEDLNDGDEHPGWLTAEWESEHTLLVTYENPENDVFTQLYRIEEIDG